MNKQENVQEVSENNQNINKTSKIQNLKPTPFITIQITPSKTTDKSEEKTV
jgi:hypothetical protein